MSLSLCDTNDTLQSVRSIIDGGELLRASSTKDLFNNSCKDTKSAAAINRRGELYVYGVDGYIRLTRLRDVKLHKREIVKRLQCLHQLPSDVEEICFNATSEYLAVRSHSELHVVLLPQDLIRVGFLSDEDIIRCRSVVIIGENESSLFPQSDIVDFHWHPMSNQHLCVLHADNTLRMFTLEDIELTIDLIVGERLVHRRQFSSFCFGSAALWAQFSIYLLHTCGDIYYVCPVVPKHCSLSRALYLALKTEKSTHTSKLQSTSTTPANTKSISMATIESDSYYERVKRWLEKSWKVSTKKQSFFFSGDDLDDDIIGVQMQGPLSMEPVPTMPRHPDSTSTNACSITTMPSLCPINVILLAFSSGHVDVLMDVATAMPSWRNFTASKLSLSKISPPPLLFLHRLDLALQRPDESLCFLLSSTRDFVYLQCNDGLLAINTSAVKKIIMAAEKGDSNIDTRIADVMLSSRLLLKIDRYRRIGLNIVSDALLGHFAFGIDADFRFQLIEDTLNYDMDHKSAREPSPSFYQAQDEHTFSVNSFADSIAPLLDTNLSLEISHQTQVTLSNPDSLKIFVKDCKHMYDAIDKLQALQFAIEQRVDFNCRFESTQSAYLEHIAAAVKKLQARQYAIKSSLDKCQSTMINIAARVSSLYDRVERKQNSLSREETQYHDELERLEQLLPSLQDNQHEFARRVERVVKRNQDSTSTFSSWPLDSKFSPLRESHSRRLKPVIGEQTKQINENVLALKKLRSLLNTEFPDMLDANNDDINDDDDGNRNDV